MKRGVDAMRKYRREHGAITVFLSFVMACIIAFMGMLVDIARLRVSESQIKRAGQLAMDATMTQYSRRLREDYGLYGYAGTSDVGELYQKYFEANLRPDAEKPEGEFYKLLNQFTGDKIKYGDMLRIAADEDQCSGSGQEALSDPDVLYRQIVEFCKFRIPLTLALDGRLEDLGKIQSTVYESKNDMESVNETQKLNGPMEEYAGEEQELEKVVSDLNEAIELTNEAIDHWNDLLEGRVEGWYAATEISLDVYEVEIDPDDGQLIRSMGYNHDRTFNYAMSFGPVIFYDLNAATEALTDIRDNTLNRMADQVFANARSALEQQGSLLNKLYDNYSFWADRYNNADDSDPDKGEYYNSMNSAWDRYQWVDSNHSDMRRQYESDLNAFMDAQQIVAQQGYDNIISAALLSLDNRTRLLQDERNAGRQMIEDYVSQIDNIIALMVDTKKDVEATIDDVTDTLERRRQGGKCSQQTYENWRNHSDGDADLAEKEIQDNEERLEKLKPQIQTIREWVLDYNRRSQEIEDAQIVNRFMNAAEYATGDWNGSLYTLSHVDGDDPEYEPFPDKDSYEEKRQEAERQADERKEAADRAAEEDRAAETVRYNPEPIPSEYSALFVTRSTAPEDQSIKKPNKPSKDSKASEATEGSNQMTNLMQDVAGKVGSSLLNAIGGVYAGEYIMRMFGNAAPEQKDNHYPENEADFKYAHVVTLRNGQPVGLPEYQSFTPAEGEGYVQPRLGYFYNAEVEYILFGGENEKGNVNHGKVMLEGILVVSNYLQVRNSPELKAIANAAAAAGLAVGIPAGLTRFLVYMGFAFAETVLDMHYLMRGYRIPAFSTKAEDLFIVPLRGVNVILEQEGAFMVSYEFYLRIRLLMSMLFGSRDIMMRTANLIQLNIRYTADQQSDKAYKSDSSFDIKTAYTTFSGTAGGKMPWWFMTQAIMGSARTEEGWAVIPGYTLVSSY